MRNRIFLALVHAGACLLVSGNLMADDPKSQSSDIPSGTWEANTVISAGIQSQWNHEVIIKNGQLIFKRKDKQTDGQIWDIVIDASKNPKQITMRGTSGRPKTINAIYSHSKRDLRIAFLPGENGSSLEKRPTDIASTAKNKAIVFVLTRKK